MNLPGFTSEASLHGNMGGYMSAGFATDAATPPDSSVSPQASEPVWGYYCGARWPCKGGNYEQVAFDPVDQVCKDHDWCYENTGPFKCGCDVKLLGAMPGAIRSTPYRRGKWVGRAAILYFGQRVARGTCMFWPC